MNYLEYIEQVKTRLNQMTEQEKTEWIQQIARKKQENEWDSFLDSLHFQTSKTDFDKGKLTSWCEKVRTGSFYFHRVENAFYYDDYENEDFYEYEDDHQISETFLFYYDEACRQLNQRTYQEAFTIFKQLFSLTFSIKDSIEKSREEVSFIDSFTFELLPISEEDFLYPFLYTILQSLKGEERLETLYQGIFSYSLEKVLSYGPEEFLSLNVFLKEWIDFLKEKEEERSTDLLIEGALLYGGLNEVKTLVLEERNHHLGLSLYLVEQLFLQGNYQEAEKIGLLSLEKSKNKSKIRGEIARLTGLSAKKCQHQAIFQRCQFEVFEINPRFPAFFSFILLFNQESVKEKMIHLVEAQSEEEISREKKKIFLFFLGDYDSLVTRKKRKNLPHFFSDDRIDIALLLFLLNQSQEKSPGKEALFQHLFSNLSERQIDRGEFIETLKSWKVQQGHIQEAGILIEQVEKEIALVAEEIVGGGFRQEYQKVALFVQLLDEVKASNGIGESKDVRSFYQQKYKRKRAFQQELEKLS